jgi:hypothetical protein
MPDERKYETVRYSFTLDELRELGAKLATEVQALLDLREQKSATLADFSAQIKSAEQVVRDTTLKIAQRSEDREIEVLEILSTPRPGWKRIIRIDDNTTLRELPMTTAEMQQDFSFSEGEPNDPQPPGAG